MIYLNMVLVLFLVLFTGCTTISITSLDGQTKIERVFGFASVSVQPTETPVLVEMISVGFASGPAGYVIGISNQEIAFIPESCRVVFWVKDEKEARAVQHIITSNNGFCSIAVNQ